jgi:hypothetical protein
MSFFKKYWPPALQDDVVTCAEAVVRAVFKSVISF